MAYALLKTLHLLAIIVWVGGMAFAHFFLRPAVAALDGPARLKLMSEVLRRFFAAVGVAVVAVLGSGLWMIGHASGQAAETGGALRLPHSWVLMAALGFLMTGIFGYIRLALYPRLQRAVAEAAWPAGAAAMAQIRAWVRVNLALGVLIVVSTLLGPAL
jgi:uncharacterized membrane protein